VVLPRVLVFCLGFVEVWEGEGRELWNAKKFLFCFCFFCISCRRKLYVMIPKNGRTDSFISPSFSTSINKKGLAPSLFLFSLLEGDEFSCVTLSFLLLPSISNLNTSTCSVWCSCCSPHHLFSSARWDLALPVSLHPLLFYLQFLTSGTSYLLDVCLTPPFVRELYRLFKCVVVGPVLSCNPIKHSSADLRVRASSQVEKLN